MLERLGLHRRELRAWAMYDWANSAVQTTTIGAIFPIYFQREVAAGLGGSVATARFAWATTIAILIVAIVAPVLGAIADYAGVRKKMLAAFMAFGAAAAGAMYGIGRGDWLFALVLFVGANVGVAGSIVFYESLLPHIASQHELDRVSSAGYAIGYLGGGVLLAVNVLMIQRPSWFGLADAGAATRVSLASVAVWWLVFSIPLFRVVPEPPRLLEAGETGGEKPVVAAFRRLGATLRELRAYRQAFLLLLAFLLYNDGIQTFIRMAAIYGTEIGLGQGAITGAFLLVQFVGVPFAFLFGMLAGRIGAKPAVFLGLAVYSVVTLMAYRLNTATQFFTLALLVGMVQGGTQALSRSMFAAMIPRERSSEFFSFFGVFERYAGVLGPAIFAWTVSRTGSSRSAVLAVLAFFVVGALLLARVDVEEGTRAARAAEQQTHAG
ncbi:MAG TPA: MFS transporter [Vicinamibacterales bacterium]|nr:MFS transporter [Vicinamibacterales bacterium]